MNACCYSNDKQNTVFLTQATERHLEKTRLYSKRPPFQRAQEQIIGYDSIVAGQFVVIMYHRSWRQGGFGANIWRFAHIGTICAIWGGGVRGTHGRVLLLAELQQVYRILFWLEWGGMGIALISTILTEINVFSDPTQVVWHLVRQPVYAIFISNYHSLFHLW